MIYAIGDIHGMIHKLTGLYNNIMSDMVSRPAEHSTIIFLGDYVDRGPHSKDVLDFLMGLKNTELLTHVFIKGNHEDMMIEAYSRKTGHHVFLSNGGEATLKSFNCSYVDEFYHNPIVTKYVEWCRALPTIHIIGNYAFVHGGYDPRIPAAEQSDDVLMWKRSTPYMEGREYENCEYTIVHGHTPKHGPVRYKNEINVDTNAYYDGNLTAVCIPNDDNDITFISY